jgi:hypothetical protein
MWLAPIGLKVRPVRPATVTGPSVVMAAASRPGLLKVGMFLSVIWCKPVESNHLPLGYRPRPSPFGLACACQGSVISDQMSGGHADLIADY